jgi:hypothetical protein
MNPSDSAGRHHPYARLMAQHHGRTGSRGRIESSCHRRGEACRRHFDRVPIEEGFDIPYREPYARYSADNCADRGLATDAMDGVHDRLGQGHGIDSGQAMCEDDALKADDAPGPEA